MAANMYRVGDYVFFETSSTSPYQIRRIEELSKTPNGNVEAKVMCFYRRRDISSSLIMLADKHQSALEEEQEGEGDVLAEKHRHQLKHRELFLSRQVETLPATHIRGKCTVTLLNETESLLSYLNKDDTFFYSLVYDPQQKTLLADKGEIRVGSKFQAEVIPLLKEGEDDGRVIDELETLIWTPNHNLTDRQIDQFLVIARSVGTFARALDCTSSVKQPSLHMSAAAASRDVTLFHAMDILHKHNYNIANAICSLVPSTGPVLCRDEMEEWSASEANLFEEALEKYGKDFNDIRQDFLPWKSLKNIIEYYYMWKTTDRYVQQKRVKAVEAESKLKQVYIPNYNKPNPAAISAIKPGMMNGANGASDPPPISGKACESCYTTQSSQWYAWGPIHMQCRLCSTCWNYWKKYGGLKMPTRLDGRLLVDFMLNREKEVERYTPGINNVSPTIFRKRPYEEVEGILGPAAKRPLKPIAPTILKPQQQEIYSRNLMPRGSVINHLNGRAKLATINKLGRKQVLSWVDAPDDVYFQATDGTRKLRKQLTPADLRKAARRPWRKLNVKFPVAPSSEIVVLD